MKLYRTIVSIFLAFLVILSSTSFMVGLHLCSGRVQSLALFTKAEGCAMEKKVPVCKIHAAKPCCEDETIIHQGEDFKISTTNISLNPALSVEMVLPPVLLAEVIPSTPLSPALFYHYDPPLRAADLTVSFGVFLI